MILYDATINQTLPFNAPPTNEKIIRCVYNHTGYISLLTGVRGQTGINLLLQTQPGFTLETSTNTIHHHISILSQNPNKYAALFGTKRFIIVYHKLNRVKFLQARFPEWTLVGYDENGYPEMELIIV